MNSPGVPFDSDQAAAKVLTCLANGKWRKARDFAKELCKKDRPRYLPLLIQANSGLVRELVGKGLLPEARTVLDYLKTIAPPEVVATLEAEIAAPPTSQSQGIAPEQSGAVITALWPDILCIASAAGEGAACSPSEIAVIDDVVTAFSAPSGLAENDLSASVARELAAVQAACEASSEGRWDEASSHLRALPARSVFRHWKVFLRGLRLIFQKETAEAERCFARLPPGSACAIAADVIAGRTPANAPRPAARAAWWLATAGEQTDWAPGIAAAELAWKKDDWQTACRELSQSLGKTFGNRTSGVPAALSNALVFMGEIPSEYATRLDKGMLTVWNAMCRKQNNPGPLHTLLLRALILRDEPGMDAYFLASEWKQVLLWETKALGPNVIRESQGWQWLGEKLSTPAPAIFRVFASGKPEVRDAREAERCFRKAVEGDPGNEAAWLGLLDLLEGLKKDAARNRLLDDLVERFPANKSLAFRAGKLAMQRKAFGKATRFFEEVKRLDPLDRETDAWLAGALIARAREAFARKKSVPEIWERIESLADPSPSCADLRRARWVVHLQRALLDPGQTDTARAKAAALAPSPTRLLASEYLLSSEYRLEVPEEWYAKWECCLQCPWSELHELLGLVLHFAQTHSLQKHEADGPEYFIMQEAITAALVRGLIEADPPGAFAFSQNLRKRSPHESTRAENLREAILVQINRAAKNTAAVTRSKDPHLRYLALAAEKLHDLDIPSKSYLSKVRQLISDAEAAGIAQLAAAARLLIREDSNTFDEDAFDEDWEDDDEAGFSSAQAISNLFKRIAKKTAAKKTKAKKTPSSKPAPSRAPGPESEPNETQPDLDLFSPRPSP